MCLKIPFSQGYFCLAINCIALVPSHVIKLVTTATNIEIRCSLDPSLEGMKKVGTKIPKRNAPEMVVHLIFNRYLLKTGSILRSFIVYKDNKIRLEK